MYRLIALVFATFHLLQPTVVYGQAVTPAIAFGARHAVALGANGDVLTWGDNVMCQLGRPGGNSAATPGLALRNAIQVAAAADHTMALTADGKVYGWGANPEGALGVGNTYDQCQGPALVESLEGKGIVAIATGNGFSVALSSSGDLYCSGDNGMGQCPVAKGGRIESFAQVPIPELAGNVAAVKAGAFHVLALTKDGALYAFGRGRDGQLGNGKTVNGVTRVPEMTGVVSFAAGTWHSAAVKADGTAWLWGNNGKSQLCDGATANRASPAKVVMAAGLKVTEVVAGGHATLLRGANGELYGCGDNQFGALGTDKPAVVPQPTLIAARHPCGGHGREWCQTARSAPTAARCALPAAPTAAWPVALPRPSPFAARAGLSLCGARPAAALPDLIRVLPSGGESGCWTPRLEEDSCGSAGVRAASSRRCSPPRASLRQNAAFMAAPVPVRMRTSLSAGPLDDGGAADAREGDAREEPEGTTAVERGVRRDSADRSHWRRHRADLDLLQPDAEQFVSQNGDGAEADRTGLPATRNTTTGSLITKDGRLPWIPQTLADKLDAEGERRRKKLEEWQQARSPT